MLNNNVNPITQKLLNKEVSLKDLTLEKFREGRTIYPTYKEAQAKGFEGNWNDFQSMVKRGEIII